MSHQAQINSSNEPSQINEYISKEQDQFAHHLGCFIEYVGKYTCTLRLDLQPYMFNQFGSVHGGIIATLCDEVAGIAAHSTGEESTTLNLNIHFIKPSFGVAYLRAKATPIHLGRSTLLFQIQVEDPSGKVVTDATATYFSVDPGRYQLKKD